MYYVERLSIGSEGDRPSVICNVFYNVLYLEFLYVGIGSGDDRPSTICNVFYNVLYLEYSCCFNFYMLNTLVLGLG